MLSESDYIQINDINTIQPEDMPGAWSAAYDFKEYVSQVEPVVRPTERLCTTMHRPIMKNCPLGDRPLYPRRTIEQGRWSLTPEPVDDMEQSAPVRPGISGVLLIIFLIIASLIIFSK